MFSVVISFVVNVYIKQTELQQGNCSLISLSTTVAIGISLRVNKSRNFSSAKWWLVFKRQLNGCCISIKFFQVVESSLLRKKYMDNYITWHDDKTTVTWLNNSRPKKGPSCGAIILFIYAGHTIAIERIDGPLQETNDSLQTFIKKPFPW